MVSFFLESTLVSLIFIPSSFVSFDGAVISSIGFTSNGTFLSSVGPLFSLVRDFSVYLSSFGSSSGAIVLFPSTLYSATGEVFVVVIFYFLLIASVSILSSLILVFFTSAES
jgi:hypothetical protein